MPKPVLLRLILKILELHGFYFVSQKGSHQKFSKIGRTVIIPVHGKEIPYGTFRSIIKQSGLAEEDFKGKAGEL